MIWFNRSGDVSAGEEALTSAGFDVELSREQHSMEHYRTVSAGNYDLVVLCMPKAGIVEHCGFLARNALRTPIIIFVDDPQYDMASVLDDVARVLALAKKYYPWCSDWFVDATNATVRLIEIASQALEE